MILYLTYNLLSIIEVMLILRIVLSWIGKERYNSITIWICNFFDPILSPIQKILPSTMGIDVSPIIVFILIDFLKNIIARSYY